jgi:chemotaxis protein CheY-P-specific phosphatase CheC
MVDIRHRYSNHETRTHFPNKEINNSHSFFYMVEKANILFKNWMMDIQASLELHLKAVHDIFNQLRSIDSVRIFTQLTLNQTPIRSTRE